MLARARSYAYPRRYAKGLGPMNQPCQLMVAFDQVDERMRDLHRAVADFLLRPDDLDRISELERSNWSLLAADENLRRTILELYSRQPNHVAAVGEGHTGEPCLQHSIVVQ